jgi:uncharacterized protein (TIGR02145 family)
MTTYSFVQYDVLTGGMYFKGTPTPDLDLTISEGSISSLNTKEYLQYIQTEGNLPVTQSASQAIISYLNTVSEIDLNNSKTVVLTIEILDNTTSGNVNIVSKNLDGTKTYALKSSSFSPGVVEWIKPLPTKWITMDKNCPNCIKASFFGTGSSSGSIFNFTGDIGGQYAGTYANGQKSYFLNIPSYSSASGYGNTEQYTVFWKPNVTYTGTDYAGNTITISNQHKWIATPTANIGTAQELSNKTFFHVSSMFTASCPVYDPTPTSLPSWNFRGNQGFFSLNTANSLPDKPCPTFIPNPGTVNWGYNCDPLNGCVSSPSGSIGQYASLSACVSASCSPYSEPTSSTPINYGYLCIGPNQCVTGSINNPGLYNTFLECLQGCPPTYGWNCSNGCVPGTEGNTGSFATYEDCVASNCGVDPIITCSCNPLTNLVTNSNFSNGSSNWSYSPTVYNPLAGAIGFSLGYVQASTVAPLSTSLTSSLFVSQPNMFNVSCSYEVCFQAWQDGDNPSAVISINSDLTTLSGLSNIPTAQTFTYTATTTDLTFYFGVSNGGAARINIDDICVTLLSCPPSPTEDCIIISGSASTYETGSFGLPCNCPSGYISNGAGNCIASGSIVINKKVTGVALTASIVTQPVWGISYPILYYYYDQYGNGSSSISPSTNPNSPSHPSPYFGNPNVYNTAYTFDLLKASFWKGYSTNYNSCGLSAQLFKQIPANTSPIVGSTGSWYGGGSYLNVASSKTYYVALIGDDIFRFKLDNNTIIEISGSSIYQPDPFGQMNYQNFISHKSGNITLGGNPYLPINLTSINSWFQTNWTYRSLHIYPVTIPAGCHYITLEGADTGGTYAGFGGLILDNTTDQIINAQTQYDLNIIWDSRTDLLWNLNTTSSITASCPPGTTSIGTGSCSQCLATGSSIPCGDCLDCFNGILYNGYVVDKGGSSFKGRGTGGIVNTNVISNPINTWVIPDETDWNTLITYLNGGTTPSTVTQTGSLGTIVGGKLKEYTRDSIASCWEFPNAGSTTSTNNSGWSGTAAGKRDNYGNFSGLGFSGYWWSANSLSTPPASNGVLMATRELKHYSSDIFRNIYTKDEGNSIRLVRPTGSNELDGATIFDAYIGNDGKLYDGIVIDSQVWITKNLNETKYNNNVNISLTPNPQTWIASLNTGTSTSCYYSNSTANTSSFEGNINPATGLCYEFPPLYVYQNCNTSEILLQTVSGSTTTAGKTQKAPNGDCWSFVETTTINNNNYVASIYSTSNYFSGSNYVYNNCSDCEAIHTIYMKFGTKNC